MSVVLVRREAFDGREAGNAEVELEFVGMRVRVLLDGTVVSVKGMDVGLVMMGFDAGGPFGRRMEGNGRCEEGMLVKDESEVLVCVTAIFLTTVLRYQRLIK